MEVPEVVRARLDDDERVYAGVPLGESDIACLTPSRTLVYRGEGLLSDESVESYPHSVERLSMSEGRRKTKFVFEYVDGTRTLKVSGDRADPLLERLLEAIFRQQGVIDSDESVAGSFRFSELTVVVTDSRLVKRIGEAVWGDDYEVYRFADVTGLDFEPGSVATQIVIEADGRPQRIKAPNEQASLVKRTLTNALFDFHDVQDIDEFRATVGAGGRADRTEDDDIDFGSDIDPLVDDGSDGDDEWSMDRARETDRDTPTGGRAEEADDDRTPQRTDDPSGGRRQRERADRDPLDAGAERGREKSDRRPQQSDRLRRDDGATDRRPVDDGRGSADERRETADDRHPGDQRRGTREEQRGAPETRRDPADGRAATDGRPATAEDLAAVTQQLTDLTEAVERQNELLEKQHRALQRLLEGR